MPGSGREQRAARPSPAVVRHVIETDGTPDLFVDEFWITWNQNTGATLTLLVNIPGDPNGKGELRARIVGRVRMPLLVAGQLGQLISEQIKLVPIPQPTDGPKN